MRNDWVTHHPPNLAHHLHRLPLLQHRHPLILHRHRNHEMLDSWALCLISLYSHPLHLHKPQFIPTRWNLRLVVSLLHSIRSVALCQGKSCPVEDFLLDSRVVEGGAESRWILVSYSSTMTIQAFPEAMNIPHGWPAYREDAYNISCS